MTSQIHSSDKQLPGRRALALTLALLLILAQVVLLAGPALAAGPQAPSLQTPTRTRATPQPRNTPTPVATPTEAAPVFDCDLAPAEVPSDWQLALCESFSDNANGWMTGENTSDFGTISRQVQDGAYVWDLNAKQGVYWSAQYPGQLFSDFYMSAAIQVASGPDTTQYGLQFRWVDGDNFYAFNVNDTKQYRVDLMYRGNWQTVIDWTDSEAILPGEVNLLAVKAEGRHFTFFINDENVAEINDSRLKTGLNGVGADLPQADQAAVSFDDLQVWVSPTSDNPTTTPTTAVEDTPTPRVTARATPRVTPKVSPTRRPARATPTPTPAPETCGPDSAIAPADWSSVLCDDFADDSYGWPVGTDSGQYADITRSIDGGTYTWEIASDEGVFSAAYPDMDFLTDFFVAAEAMVFSGPDDMSYGVTFRHVDSDNYYALLVNDVVQEFKVDLLEGGNWETLVEWTHSEAIVPGDMNTLAVLGEGSQFTIFINDEQVGDLTDDRLTEGEVGLLVDLGAAEDAIVDFTLFDVRAPAASGRDLRTPTAVASLDLYECMVCGYIYDPEVGDPDNGISAGTAFADLPEDWTCPDCGVGKELFEPV